MIDKLQKNKIPYGGNKNERDFDDIVPVVEFSNISLEHKDFCFKKAKEAMSNIIYFKNEETIMESEINYYKKLSKFIKKNLEEELKGIWNVIIGTDFGSYISYDKSHLIYFRINEIYFIIFRYGEL